MKKSLKIVGYVLGGFISLILLRLFVCGYRGPGEGHVELSKLKAEHCTFMQKHLSSVYDKESPTPYSSTLHEGYPFYPYKRKSNEPYFLYRLPLDLKQGRNAESVRRFEQKCPDFLPFFDKFRLEMADFVIKSKGKDIGNAANDFLTDRRKRFLSVFEVDPDFLAKNQAKYSQLKQVLIDAEAREDVEEKDLTETKDGAYRVFLNTAHLPDQTLTNDQLSQNERHYKGKKFTNWTLILEDESGGCLKFMEPNGVYSWGSICNAPDVTAFKAKYPNYRKGLAFTIKSGTIDRWVIGPYLKDLTF